VSKAKINKGRNKKNSSLENGKMTHVETIPEMRGQGK
jgi:hypothetical protein